MGEPDCAYCGGLHCVYCGKVGPRTIVAGGWAHKRCLPRLPKGSKP